MKQRKKEGKEGKGKGIENGKEKGKEKERRKKEEKGKVNERRERKEKNEKNGSIVHDIPSKLMSSDMACQHDLRLRMLHLHNFLCQHRSHTPTACISLHM